MNRSRWRSDYRKWMGEAPENGLGMLSACGEKEDYIIYTMCLFLRRERGSIKSEGDLCANNVPRTVYLANLDKERLAARAFRGQLELGRSM